MGRWCVLWLLDQGHPGPKKRVLGHPGEAQNGTNYPMIMPVRALEGIDALGLDDEVKAMFLSENARRVFKLESCD